MERGLLRCGVSSRLGTASDCLLQLTLCGASTPSSPQQSFASKARVVALADGCVRTALQDG